MIKLDERYPLEKAVFGPNDAKPIPPNHEGLTEQFSSWCGRLFLAAWDAIRYCAARFERRAVQGIVPWNFISCLALASMKKSVPLDLMMGSVVLGALLAVIVGGIVWNIV